MTDNISFFTSRLVLIVFVQLHSSAFLIRQYVCIDFAALFIGVVIRDKRFLDNLTKHLTKLYADVILASRFAEATRFHYIDFDSMQDFDIGSISGYQLLNVSKITNVSSLTLHKYTQGIRPNSNIFLFLK